MLFIKYSVVNLGRKALKYLKMFVEATIVISYIKVFAGNTKINHIGIQIISCIAVVKDNFNT